MNFKNFAAAAATVALAGASTAASAYTLTPYSVPGATSTQLWGVNDLGVLVGNDDLNGFIDDHGTITQVTMAGAVDFVRVAGISNGGVAIGGDGTTSFLWQAGVSTPFAVAGAVTTELRGISGNGRYLAGVYSTDGDDSDGFVWDRTTSTLSTIVPPAGSLFTVVQGVTNAGLAVGSLNFGGSVMFDSTTGTANYFSQLDGLDGIRLRTIDEAGDLGGWAFDEGRWIGFLDTHGGGMTTFDLGDVDNLIYGLNNVGLAVGSYVNDDGVEHSFLVNLAAVPEPAPAALMALALLAGGAWRARRRA